MSRKAVWIFVAVLGLAVIVPQVVYAATGTFSSSSSSTALTAVNSGSGRAINASSKTGYTGVFTRTATSGSTATLYSVQKSASSGASAVYGFSSTAGSGSTYGVYGRSAASAGRGVFGYATRTSGANSGVYGRTLSAGDGASGVFGFASSTGGSTCGVCGQSNGLFGLGVGGFGPGIGAFGFGDLIGVAGTSSGIGDGSLGLDTDTDTGLGAHVIVGNGDLSGTCTIADAQTTSPDCNFTHAFPTGTTPMVVVTPTTDPGAAWYVMAPAVGDGTTGFRIHLSGSATATGAVTFNYVVVGFNSDIVPASAARISSAKASAASR